LPVNRSTALPRRSHVLRRPSFDPLRASLLVGDGVANQRGLRGGVMRADNGRLAPHYEDGSTWEGDIASRCLFCRMSEEARHAGAQELVDHPQ
jgi:hypothetical protein